MMYNVVNSACLCQVLSKLKKGWKTFFVSRGLVRRGLVSRELASRALVSYHIC